MIILLMGMTGILLAVLFLNTYNLKESEKERYGTEQRALTHYSKLHKIEMLIRTQEEFNGNEFTTLRAIKEVIYPDRKIKNK